MADPGRGHGSDLPLQPGAVLERRPVALEGHAGSGSQQSGRRGVDRPVQGALRHPRHPRTLQDRQDRIEWLHPADQLERARSGGRGQAGHAGPAAGVAVKYLAWAFAGLLLAAAVHIARMAPAERARILQVAPAGQVTPARGATGADGLRDGPAEAPPASRPAGDAGVTAPSAWPRDTGSKPPLPAVPAPPVLPSGLVLPVQGVQPAQLSPTFDDARGEDRRHEALDVMAPAGTP